MRKWWRAAPPGTALDEGESEDDEEVCDEEELKRGRLEAARRRLTHQISQLSLPQLWTECQYQGALDLLRNPLLQDRASLADALLKDLLAPLETNECALNSAVAFHAPRLSPR
jgi:hypothetical protein